MIKIKNLAKSFHPPGGQVQVLKDINLEVKRGEILGIIGPSGAGKSTLLRCMNFLERPSRGTVALEGELLNNLDAAGLRRVRQKTGMIFQEFNLFYYQNVAQNISFPLRIRKMPAGEIRKRVAHLLEVVGIPDKAGAYPAQLSGGQKQRVGIARALAGSPKILFSDEATSSLDEKTSRAILDLLQEINRELGLTIVLITHEKDVIQRICTRVISLEGGQINDNYKSLPPSIQAIKDRFPGEQLLLLESSLPGAPGKVQGELLWQNGQSSVWRVSSPEKIKADFRGNDLKGVFI